MKILVYNIDHGGKEKNNKKKRWSLLQNAIKKINPDVTVLLEAWHWTKKELKFFQKKCGFHSGFLSTSNTPHHIAVLSKIKIQTIKRIKRGFHHSIVIFKIQENNKIFQIIGAHLYPHSENKRLEEIKKIVSLAKRFPNTLMVGDFNALSHQDPYDKRSFWKKLKRLKIKKFGENHIEYKVIPFLIKSGYIDILKKYSGKKSLINTVPTKKKTDAMHMAPMRLDYAFGSKKSLSNIQRASVIKNFLTHYASDHYPLLLRIRVEK